MTFRRFAALPALVRRPVGRLLLEALALTVLLLSCGDGEGEGESGLPELQVTASAKVPPSEGALLGAFVGVGDASEKDFAAQEELIGRRWAIDHRFYAEEDAWLGARTQWAAAHHKIPLVTWEPWEHKLEDIVAGKHDATIRKRAQEARAFGTEIMLRWGHEMNGNWYPWSGAMNGAAEGGAEKYVAAYRHVHDLFEQEGASNVVWIWCPLVTDVPNQAWNHWTHYYPGDDYVDWVGLDAYNWGTSSSCCVWQSFRTLISRLYKDYAGKKPLMLPETSSAELGGSKPKWIEAMRQDLKTDFTAIKAVVWFDIDKETDWRIASSPETLEAYKAMAHDPYFNP